MTAPQKIESDAAGLYWESRVSEALGVPRKVLAGLRTKHLKEGEHFAKQKKNAVALTPAGLTRINELLQAYPEGQPGCLPAGKQGKTDGNQPSCAANEHNCKKTDAPAGPPPRELMTVQRISQNGGLLLCLAHKRVAPVLVAVRVRENTNFVAGMIIEAIESKDRVWQFHNRAPGEESTVGRLPRGKGRW